MSVIVPVYNAEKYLDECISSICNQSFFDIEIILINDGSRDGSIDICNAWKQKDGRIVLIDKKNEGVSATRNRGVEIASSEYITFVDSDDIISVDYCEKLYNFMADDTDIVVCGLMKMVGDKEIPISHRIKDGVYNSEELYPILIDDGTMSGFTMHSPCAVLYRKKIIDEQGIRFNTEVKYNEDGLFNTEYIFNSTGKISVNFESRIYYYRTNDASATRTLDVMGESYRYAMNVIHNVLKEYIDDNDSRCVKKQLFLRKGTIILQQLVYLAKEKNDYSSFLTLIKSKDYKDCLKNVSVANSSLKKRALYLLSMLKLYHVLFNLLRK